MRRFQKWNGRYQYCIILYLRRTVGNYGTIIVPGVKRWQIHTVTVMYVVCCVIPQQTPGFRSVYIIKATVQYVACCITAVAVGQRQRLYPGVRIFTIPAPLYK